MLFSKRIWIWMGAFTLLFILSLDYWNWENAIQLSFLGLPSWIYYFVLLQLIFFAAFYIFSIKCWPDSPDSDESLPR